jgi:hypothetical protein
MKDIKRGSVIGEEVGYQRSVNAIVSYIEGVTAWYDDKVNVFRIEY